MGGDIGGIARPVLLSFLDGGVDGAAAFINTIKEELRIAMLLTGSADISALKSAPHVCVGRLREWLTDLGWLEGNE